MNTSERVIDILEDEIGHHLEPEMLLADLKLGFVDMVHLTCTLEDEFDIEINDSEFQELKTVKEVIDYVEKRI